MASQVVRPRIPYRGCIPNGLHDGKLIEIRGHVPYGADIFEINLLTGLDPSSDRPLHISVRFSGRIVVRNTFQHNTWGSEDRHGTFPFHTGRDFYMMIMVEPSCYRIAVDHQHCWEFHHKIPFSRVNSIFIDGSVQIERIEFIDKRIPYQPFMHKIDPYFDPGSAVLYPGSRVMPGFPSTTCTIPGMNQGFPSTTCTIPGMNPMPFPQPGITPVPFPNPGCIIPPPEQMRPTCPQPSFIAQPATVSSNLAPVYNPSIPYAYPIYGGLKPGMMIYISGRPSASAYRFTLNLQSGTSPYPPPDIAFHFDARFFSNSVVRNSRTNNTWDREETLASHFPFQQAVNFDMIIRVENDRYMIALNGQHFVEFRHRLHPLTRFDTLYIENDIVVSSIRFS